ncbi:Aquaporin-9 [Caenorhabditis elegans]|nr:Aquaporin-9 [Caenorhabditis elegans]SPC48674.1 Aquaporin-9 [Caenorhabditis elegans]|eukprot:NP_001348813.1 AQuaPorin or aquaglyceroporin related [Caenorhabditis elegans]
MLSGLVCLITDKRHQIPTGVVPVLAGSIMSMVAMTFGANGGFAINPARDFGPRVFCLCAGYGWEVFSAHGYYFWIPIVGALIGSIIGAWIYKIFVGLHGMNESLDIQPAKGFNEMQRNSEGILIGYDNTLSRARGGEIAAPRTYTPSYQVFESSRTQITTADRRY